MFERFTETAREAVVRAQGEARALGHTRMGTEHLLLALLDQPETTACRLLTTGGLTHEMAVDSVRAHGLGSGTDGTTPGAAPGGDPVPAHLPFTPGAKKALELSVREAVRLHHRHIGDGHLLLGLLREKKGLATTVLREHGLDPGALRGQVTESLGP